jgi:hypothetical protein
MEYKYFPKALFAVLLTPLPFTLISCRTNMLTHMANNCRQVAHTTYSTVFRWCSPCPNKNSSLLLAARLRQLHPVTGGTTPATNRTRRGTSHHQHHAVKAYVDSGYKAPRILYLSTPWRFEWSVHTPVTLSPIRCTVLFDHIPADEYIARRSKYVRDELDSWAVAKCVMFLFCQIFLTWTLIPSFSERFSGLVIVDGKVMEKHVWCKPDWSARGGKREDKNLADYDLGITLSFPFHITLQ